MVCPVVGSDVSYGGWYVEYKFRKTSTRLVGSAINDQDAQERCSRTYAVTGQEVQDGSQGPVGMWQALSYQPFNEVSVAYVAVILRC